MAENNTGNEVTSNENGELDGETENATVETTEAQDLETVHQYLEEITQRMESLENLSQVMTSSITTYAIVWVPLILLITALWWFFKQFIY